MPDNAGHSMSDLVRAARERIAQLQAELDTLTAFIESADKVAVMLNGAKPAPAPAAVIPAVRPAAAPPAPKAARRGPAPKASAKVRLPRGTNPSPAAIVEGSIDVLRARGEPLSRRDLHAALAERGLVVQGSDPFAYLGTMLWRAKDKVNYIKDRGYWPKGDRVPA